MSFRAEVQKNATDNGTALEVVAMDEDTREVFIAAFNKVEPANDYAPDEVWLMGAQGYLKTLVVMTKSGCILAAIPIPNQVLMMMMQGFVPGKQRGA